ncbi:MAG: TonB family protein [Candidatus Aminicenantes bacterium]|nr:TonB family protein [Candidatus Aminicenantes bacterium]
MEMYYRHHKAFKKAMILSASVHLALFIMLIVSPYFPKPGRKGMVHYVNLVSLGGGGGGGRPGGGGGSPPEVKTEAQAETAVPERETLRDLTTPQQMEQVQPPSMTHPADKPQRDSKPKPEKKGVIQKAQLGDANKTSPSTTTSGGGSGTGSRVGLGLGGGGFGFGGGYGQIGLSDFPYTYYLQAIHAKISNNWVTALIRSGASGNLASEVSFKIYRNGRISDPEIRTTSGNRTMDLSAIRAIRNSSPFPPLPRDYEDEYLIVRLIFEHAK